MHLRPHSAGDELLGLARETVRFERNRASFPGLHRLPYDSWMRACTSGRGMWFEGAPGERQTRTRFSYTVPKVPRAPFPGSGRAMATPWDLAGRTGVPS